MMALLCRTVIFATVVAVLVLLLTGAHGGVAWVTAALGYWTGSVDLLSELTS